MKAIANLIVALLLASTAQAANTNSTPETWDSKFAKALADRDERLAMLGAMKGVELGALIAWRLLDENFAAYTGTNRNAISKDAKLVAERSLAGEEFSTIGTLAEQLTMADDSHMWTVTNNAVANTNIYWIKSTAITNQVATITNIVIKSNLWLAETDAHSDRYSAIKIPINAASRTNIVNTLVESGEFCRVRGHIWDAMHIETTLLYNPNPGSCRQCSVCKLHQERQPGEWK